MSFARVQEVHEGEMLVADGGFTCLKSYETCEVRKDGVGQLYVKCRDGRHYLDGQFENGEYVGLTLAE